MKKLGIIVFSIVLLVSFKSFSFPISIPVSESVVNYQVTKSFPKTVKKIELANPQVVLLQNKAVICMEGVPQIMFLDKKFKFCATFKPEWNTETAELKAKDLQLTDFDMDKFGKVPDLLKSILNKEVLPNIGSISLYKSDSWITKQISSVELDKGMMYIHF